MLRRLLAAGDAQTACEKAHEWFAADVRRFVHSLRHARSVDDLCQDIWTVALTALPSFRFQCSVRVWLFTIAKRKVIDAHRRDRSPLQETWDSSAEFLSRFRLPSPSSQFSRQERAAALQRALGRLSPDQREILELRYMLDLKPREIVAVLAAGTTANVVSQRLVRAARSLRAELQEEALLGGPTRLE